LTEEEWDALIAMYDAEIAYTDEMVGRIFDYIQNTSINNTIFVITADHGELFGEHGLLAHTIVLDDALINVPLVVQGVDELTEDDSDKIVQHYDIMKTLMTIAGGESNKIEGIDIRKNEREFAFSQRKPLDFEHILQHNQEFNTSRFHSSLLTSVRTDEFKYQKSQDKTELFKLPDEETDVSGEYPGIVRKLDGVIEDWIKKKGESRYSSSEEDFSNEVKDHLRDMGYLE
jgi:uncharacterized sulfatase